MAQSEKIIISVELRDKGVKSKSKKAKDSIDKLTDSSKKLAQAKRNLAIAESEEGRELAALQIKTQLATKANRELAIATMKTTKATKQGKTQTGLNNAILTEAGRAASDAQYGMQGMSNNLGQLATLMSQHAQTQGGFVASFKELGKSLMGAGGILIAIQLFISFLPILEKWYKKVTNASDDFVESLTSQQALLKTVANKLLDENTTLEERKSILESLKKDNKELYDLLVEDGKERGNTNETIKKYLGLLKNEEIIRKKIEKINEEIKETSEDLKENNEDIKKAQDVINKSLQKEKEIKEDTYFSEDARHSAINKQQAKQLAWQRIIAKEQKDSKEIEEKKVKLTEEVLLLQEDNAKIRKELGLEEKKETTTTTKDDENIFLAKTLEFVSEIKNAKKIAASDDLLTERELLDNKQKLRREELKTELDLFLAKEKIRRDLFLADKNNTKAEKAKAEETYKNSVKNAQASYDVAIDFMEKAEEAEDNLLIRRLGEAGRSLEERQKIHDADIEAIRAKIERMKGLIDSEGGEIKGLILPKTREDLDKEVEDLEKEKEIKAAQLEMFKGDIEAKMILEKEYTDLDVELTEKRMNIAQIEQDSKSKFLQDSIGLLNSASKIAKKGTDTSKAFAIASTTISTWDAAQQAYRSQMNLSPDSPIRAQIAWAAAVAKGTLNVKNIMAEKKPGGGSSGGGSSMPPVQAPDFNIIGSTGTNQLADAIGGTTQQPIKAYVVSSEVTSAQELDRNIVESASI